MTESLYNFLHDWRAALGAGAIITGFAIGTFTGWIRPRGAGRRHQR